MIEIGEVGGAKESIVRHNRVQGDVDASERSKVSGERTGGGETVTSRSASNATVNIVEERTRRAGPEESDGNAEGNVRGWPVASTLRTGASAEPEGRKEAMPRSRVAEGERGGHSLSNPTGERRERLCRGGETLQKTKEGERTEVHQAIVIGRKKLEGGGHRKIARRDNRIETETL